MQVVFFAINFVIFIIALVFLLKKPVLKYLKDRKDIFINGNAEAKKYYDDAISGLNKVKDNIRNIEKNGRAHMEEIKTYARSEANIIIFNAESYSKSMLIGTEDMVKEETERAKNEEVANFIRNVIVKTKYDVKKDTSQIDYNTGYMKDYFIESKRVKG